MHALMCTHAVLSVQTACGKSPLSACTVGVTDTGSGNWAWWQEL